MMSEATVGPLGRVSRFIIGGYLTLVALPFYLFPDIRVTFLGNTYLSNYVSIAYALAVAFGFLMFYLVVHRASTAVARSLNKWLGAMIANIPPLAVFIFAALTNQGPVQIAVFTYVGVAMIVAGLRRDRGCEVMSPANAILRKQTHFGCIVFSPIDWAEDKTKKYPSGGQTNSLSPSSRS